MAITRQTKFITAGTNSGNTGFTNIGGNSFGTVRNTSGGSVSTSTPGLYWGSALSSLYHTGSHLVLEIADVNDNVVNAGWDRVIIGGTTFLRYQATYTEDYTTYIGTKIDRWQWNNVSSPFTNGQEEEVDWDNNQSTTTASSVSQTINGNSDLIFQFEATSATTKNILNTDTFSWTRDVQTTYNPRLSQIQYASVSSDYYNCTPISGSSAEGSSITIAPIQPGEYYAVIEYSHATTGSDTGYGINLTGVRKRFMVKGSVNYNSTHESLYSIGPYRKQFIRAGSGYLGSAGSEPKPAQGLGTNKSHYALTRIGPFDDGGISSPIYDHFNGSFHEITFTNTNCQTWNANLTSQISSTTEGTLFAIVPTGSAGSTYSCVAELSIQNQTPDPYRSWTFSGRIDQLTEPHDDYGLLIHKAYESRFPRLSTADRQGFENTIHTGTLTKGSSVTISVPGITLNGQDWGVQSAPFNEHFKLENPSTGSIKFTRKSTDPSVTTNRPYTIRTFKLTS